jgi:hypothetical protein
MNKVKQIKLLKINTWFLDQVNKPESVPEKFYWTFLLKFILKNLKKEPKKQFINLLEKQKTDQILSFVFKNINDFEKRFSQALGEKLAKIQRNI